MGPTVPIADYWLGCAQQRCVEHVMLIFAVLRLALVVQKQQKTPGNAG